MNIVSFIPARGYIDQLKFAISIHPNSIFVIKNKYGMAGDVTHIPHLSTINTDVMFILSYLKQGRPGRQHVLQDALQRYLNIYS